jgi:hypothetical protein
VSEGQLVTITTEASDPGGGKLLFSIDWDNDGQFEEVDRADGNASHLYGAPGVYPVVVRVRDPDGGLGTGATAVVVKAGELALKVAGAGAFQEGSKVELTALLDGPKVDPVRFEWELGDGTRSVGERQSHVYRPGQYVAKATATDAAGRIGEASVTIKVANVPPKILGLEVPESIEEGNELTVTVRATDPGGPLAGLRYAFDWDGDGKYDGMYSDATVSRLFKARGEYEIGIKVTDNEGAFTEARRKIVVRRPEGGNLYVLYGFGSGGFVGITPFRSTDAQRTDITPDSAPRLPARTIPGYNTADRTVYGQWPWTMDLDVAYLLGRVVAVNLRQTFAVQGGRHYSIQPGLEFWTQRRIVTTYARTALSIHRRPDLVGTNLALGMLVNFGLPHLSLRAEIGIEPLFLGTVSPSANDPTFRPTSIGGNGFVLPITGFFGIAGNLL